MNRMMRSLIASGLSHEIEKAETFANTCRYVGESDRDYNWGRYEGLQLYIDWCKDNAEDFGASYQELANQYNSALITGHEFICAFTDELKV